MKKLIITALLIATATAAQARIVTVTLNKPPNQEWKIHVTYGTEPGVYPKTVPIEPGFLKVVLGLPAGKYCFSAFGVDKQGVKSGYAPEDCREIPPGTKPDNQHDTPIVIPLDIRNWVAGIDKIEF
jgi:hypothetical protein